MRPAPLPLEEMEWRQTPPPLTTAPGTFRLRRGSRFTWRKECLAVMESLGVFGSRLCACDLPYFDKRPLSRPFGLYRLEPTSPTQDDSAAHNEHQDPISLAVEMAAVNHTILALSRTGGVPNDIKTEASEEEARAIRPGMKSAPSSSSLAARRLAEVAQEHSTVQSVFTLCSRHSSVEVVLSSHEASQAIVGLTLQQACISNGRLSKAKYFYAKLHLKHLHLQNIQSLSICQWSDCSHLHSSKGLDTESYSKRLYIHQISTFQVFHDLRFSPLSCLDGPVSPFARAVRAARFGLDPDRLALRRFCCWRRRLAPPRVILSGLTSTP
ncbi:hypothetical protein XENOCAPTIV_007036 [Xenoophorus captivus]|uniref:Uncharacterized protein n=1 Tax=Xenoophorus captivus TaxID=1517983 RepID=A0ABV0QI29_9TELE